jgi:fumarate reductase subunit C
MSDARPQRAGLYYPKLPATWWLRRPGYVRFMLREVTSVFVAIFVVELLVIVHKIGQGPQAYADIMAKLQSPWWIVFHVVALVFVLYHTITWFQATGVVQVVRVGDRQVPPALVVAGNYVAWVVVTLFILYWLLMRS